MQTNKNEIAIRLGGNCISYTIFTAEKFRLGMIACPGMCRKKKIYAAHANFQTTRILPLNQVGNSKIRHPMLSSVRGFCQTKSFIH
jgi:hypothetical protein